MKNKKIIYSLPIVSIIALLSMFTYIHITGTSNDMEYFEYSIQNNLGIITAIIIIYLSIVIYMKKNKSMILYLGFITSMLAGGIVSLLTTPFC